jgi:TPR repeat protein
MPEKNEPLPRLRPRPPARLLLLAVLSALALALDAAPKKNKSAQNPPADTAGAAADDAAPKLISTTGGDDRRWPGLDALKKAADADDPEACFELGQMQLAGADGVEKSAALGLLHLETAAGRGHAGAAFRLGKIYADGEFTPKNPEASLKYYRLAAVAGVSEAQHNLGAAHATGRGVKRDYVEGLAWFILAAKTNPEAGAGEQRLREFLAKGRRPDLIAAGEKRAAELTEQLAAEAEKKKQDAAQWQALDQVPARPVSPRIDIPVAIPSAIAIPPPNAPPPAPPLAPPPTSPPAPPQ